MHMTAFLPKSLLLPSAMCTHTTPGGLSPYLIAPTRTSHLIVLILMMWSCCGLHFLGADVDLVSFRAFERDCVCVCVCVCVCARAHTRRLDLQQDCKQKECLHSVGSTALPTAFPVPSVVWQGKVPSNSCQCTAAPPIPTPPPLPQSQMVLTYAVDLRGWGSLGVLQLLITRLKLLALGLDAKLDTLMGEGGIGFNVGARSNPSYLWNG